MLAPLERSASAASPSAPAGLYERSGFDRAGERLGFPILRRPLP